MPSSDGTRETCIEYAKRYPDVIRLFLHHRENNIEIGGKPTGKFQSTHTRFLPRGRYFSPCDGDDYWTCANKLQLQVDNLEKHPEYSMSAGVVSSVVQKRHSGRFYPSGEIRPQTSKPCYSFTEVMEEYKMHFSSFMFRRGIVDFPEWSLDTINGDEVLLALHADWGPVGFIDKQLAAYRLHDAGIWSARSAIDHLTEALKTFDLIDKHFSGKYHDTIKIRQTRNAEFCLIKRCRK